ncbi:MAG: amino acid carrier protein, partial [Candidatus Marinimicrobia bacterium]|nr:amino acid carrier protein [Candidatus Neomarinimicrobiota bacterium]
MEVLKTVINKVNSYVWGWPEVMPLMIIILLGTGIYITFRMRWIQLFKLKHAINVIRGKYDNEEDEGDINYFQALSAALSATVGIGNIAGVATAIHYGGPGALFWMWVTAIFGMAIKFTEATLSVKYRHVHKDGTISGGPMYYIEKGLGKKWKPLAIAFAFFAMIASFGIGNSIQAFTVSDQFLSEGKLFLDSSNWLINPISFVGLQVEPIRIIVGAVLATLLAMVILGGIKRIGRVTSKLAPGMAAMYIIATFLILIFNYNEILPTFKTIFSQAFSPKAELVGLAGGGFLLFLNTMLWGVRRGLFSNEAGMGSAPIAHAAAKTKEPVREGTVAMLGPLIDTLIICSLTGLAIISTGAYN